MRVAVVGFGTGGELFHAPFVARTPGLELATIVTSDAGRRARAAAAYPGVRLLSSVEELWPVAAEHDAVVITSPNRVHVAQAMAAVAHGLATVVDKPVATTSADGRRLVDAARAAGVPLTVFQNRRWDADFLTLRALVTDGALGTVHRLESRFERWRPAVDLARWRESGQPADAGGLLFDLGSHLIDQAHVLLGPVEAVYAELDQRRIGVAAPDDVFVALTHRSGARSHLWAGALVGAPGPRFRVLASAGAWVCDDLDPQEAALRAGAVPGDAGFGTVPQDRWGHLVTGDQRVAVPMAQGRYGAFYEQLATALLHGGPLPVDPDDAVAVLEVIEAAAASARTGTVVRLGGAPAAAGQA